MDTSSETPDLPVIVGPEEDEKEPDPRTYREDVPEEEPEDGDNLAQPE